LQNIQGEMEMVCMLLTDIAYLKMLRYRKQEK